MGQRAVIKTEVSIKLYRITPQDELTNSEFEELVLAEAIIDGSPIYIANLAW